MSLDCKYCKHYGNCQNDPNFCDDYDSDNNWDEFIDVSKVKYKYIDKEDILKEINNKLDRIQLYLENPLPDVDDEDDGWNFDLSQAEEFEEYPVLIVDDYGDGTPNVNVKVGFKTSDIWVVGYEHESGVVAFHELPKPLSIQEINKRLKE